jgi:hypothetical protein
MPAVLNDLEREHPGVHGSYLRTNTYQPSIREIGEEFGIRSTKTVSEHLSALAAKGYLERDPSRSRDPDSGVDLNPNTVSIPAFRSSRRPRRGFASDGVESWLSVDRRLGRPEGILVPEGSEPRWQGFGLEVGRPPPGRAGRCAGAGTATSPCSRRESGRTCTGCSVRPLELRLQAVGDRGEALVVEDPARLVVGGAWRGFTAASTRPLPLAHAH